MSGNRALNRPTVLVTNEASASDTEIFTESYRRLGLGQVVGKPTSGRVIGTINVWLLNGSYVRLPMYGYTTPEGDDLEGTGRQVDMRIERPPGMQAPVGDPQLDAAVAVLFETLERTSADESAS
jgi:C-terminal processing protease CtpA/Prc